MGKIKAWMMEMQHLADEARMAGMHLEKEIIEYVQDNSRGRPIDKNFLIRYLAGTEERITEDNA